MTDQNPRHGGERPRSAGYRLGYALAVLVTVALILGVIRCIAWLLGVE